MQYTSHDTQASADQDSSPPATLYHEPKDRGPPARPPPARSPTVAGYLRDHFGLMLTGNASGYAVTQYAAGAVGKVLHQLKRDMHAQLIAAMAEFAINAQLPDGLPRDVWMDDVSKLAAYIPTSGWDARLTQYNLGGRNPGLDIPITSGTAAGSGGAE